MQKVKSFILIIWFICISIISPFWTGIIYMYITGHGKGYAYDLGSEADISVFLGFVLLIPWLFAIFVCIPLFVFAVLFATGVYILGWRDFLSFFGYF